MVVVPPGGTQKLIRSKCKMICKLIFLIIEANLEKLKSFSRLDATMRYDLCKSHVRPIFGDFIWIWNDKIIIEYSWIS